jgi:hypothetical protein
MTMTERTINQEQLKKVLSKLSLLNTIVGHAIQQKAFPPIFKPKKWEIIVVSSFRDFANSQIRVFSHMNVNNARYECFFGDFDETDTDTNAWIFAKPQTPTQKGE